MAPDTMKYNPAFLDDEKLIRSFVARTAELDRILEVVRENSGASNQHLLIIGPRGIGKTTLVLRAAAEIRTDPGLSSAWHPIVFGEETYQVGTPGEFWLEALFHLGQQTGDPRWQQAYEDLLRETDENRLRARTITQLMDFADAQSKRLMLVVENLNMLVGSQISSSDAWALRHTLMNEPRLMLLGTATSRFEAIDEYNQALYELFRIIELEPLDENGAKALWISTTGQRAPSNQIRPLQILTGGNPRLIRIISEFAARTSFRSLMDDLTRLVDTHTEYFKHHLDNLPPQERKVFVVLADLWDPSTARTVAEAARVEVNIASALLKRLVDRGAVTTPYKRGRAQFYQVAERMYNVYHLMRRRGPATSRVHAVVRFMVSLYQDEDLVQTTRSLVDEACQLAAGQRREHFAAYEEIMHMAREERVIAKIVEATRHAFETMPDLPPSLRKLLALEQAPQPGDEPISPVDDEAALAAADRALALEPEDATAWCNRGNALRQLDRNEEALKSIDHALTLKPEMVDAWTERAYALTNLNRMEEALEALDHAITFDPEDLDILFFKGVILQRLRRVADALETYDIALTLDPSNSRGWALRGLTLNLLGRNEEARQSSERAVVLNPNDALAWTFRGKTLRDLSRTEEAIESFDRAVALAPEDPTAWVFRGEAIRDLGRDEEALRSYDQALALSPDDADAWLLRGFCLSDLGQAEEALGSYDRAIAIDPTETTAWLNRGIVLTRLGRAQEALESYDRAIECDPNNGSMLFARGIFNMLRSRFQVAETDLCRAVVLLPNSAEAASLVELFLKTHRLEAAVNLARELAAKHDVSAGLLDRLAETMLEHGSTVYLTEAEAWSERATALAPNHSTFQFTYAKILAKQGNWTSALDKVSVILEDSRIIRALLENLIDFFIDAAAAGHEAQVAEMIRASNRANEFEPLLVAIRYLAGEQVDVAREISEIAHDVVERIEARRGMSTATE